MLSKQKSKYIASLRNKKERDEEKLYVVEGEKIVKEYLAAGIKARYLCATASFLETLPETSLRLATEVIEVSDEELGRISSMKTPNSALAVVPIPDNSFSPGIARGKLTAALDLIQDPGNLGTIIRAAAWFGIDNIVCSPDSADIYNPRTVQATMGALIRTNVRKADLASFLEFAVKDGIPVYGAFVDGKSVYDYDLPEQGIILLGNESRGISGKLAGYAGHRISIPPADRAYPGLDSLNVGMAAAVIFSEFSRRRLQRR